MNHIALKMGRPRCYINVLHRTHVHVYYSLIPRLCRGESLYSLGVRLMYLNTAKVIHECKNVIVVTTIAGESPLIKVLKEGNQFIVFHCQRSLPVLYDTTGWVRRAREHPSTRIVVQVVAESKRWEQVVFSCGLRASQLLLIPYFFDATTTIFSAVCFCAVTIRGWRLFLWKARRHQRQLYKVRMSETVTLSVVCTASQSWCQPWKRLS